MSLAAREYQQVWTWSWIKSHPVLFFGINTHLLLRTLFGIFWLAAGINKINKDWLTSDILKDIFLDRLTEMPPDAFASLFLQHFGIPLYILVAWVITFGEILSAVGLLLGLCTRPSAAISMFILLGFAIGGYYDASLIPFFILNAAFLYWPSGLWLGFDRHLNQRYPNPGYFR
ncbi:DoxX family protein [Oceanicoccus sp. KOV_DT_Chl]|uniref:DoxX family protein n=1 Tax=Oceanicoccus sp. KOV_DT_Chl TaxID=1904639 RepID=UPI000C79A153|nr:DoxX family protein [Oceanicoccus sp. KOV_DT_Chl]